MRGEGRRVVRGLGEGPWCGTFWVEHEKEHLNLLCDGNSTSLMDRVLAGERTGLCKREDAELGCEESKVFTRGIRR